MKLSTVLFILLSWFSVGAATATTAPLGPQPEHSLSAIIVTKLVEQYHYKKTHLSDAQSSEILDRYLETLDPNRSFFTQTDIDLFEPLRHRLDNALRQGKMEPAFIIFEIFNNRRIERANYALTRLEQDFNFEINEEYLFDRRDAAWPKDDEELNDIWRKRIKNDILSLMLAKKDKDELKKTLKKRYERIKTRTAQFHAEDAYSFFMNAYLTSIEPHTSYFSPRTSENFKINMSLSLEGIGAVLQTIDEHTVIQKVVTGGPADLSAQLHGDDRIVAVAQGEVGEMVDIVGWRLDDVVQLIRGPKGTVVRLQVLPKQGGLDSPVKTVVITRNKINLEQQQVKKSIIDIPDGEDIRRIGVISIPTFYMDFDAYSRGDSDYRSTTRDTRVLINELEADSVDGIVIDLRGNGGGSLPEAVSLTGLFIKSGPVVQIQGKSGRAKLNEDTDDSIAYDGPLVVLVDHSSASASEIFAGALQDYNRATIIGSPTYGKGTVQTVLNLNKYNPKPGLKLGQLKITMAQFFRINGDSTQHRGVVPDILFPTVSGDDEYGESSLDNALPWNQIPAAKFTPAISNVIQLGDIIKQHKQRISKDPGFIFLLTQEKAREKIQDKKTLSLLVEKRRQERIKNEAEQLQRINIFRTARGMEPLESEAVFNKDEKSAVIDEDTETFREEINMIKLRESAAILVDLIKQPPSNSDLLTLKSVN